MEKIVIIEKLVYGGKGFCRDNDGKVIFVVGDVLPGEKIKINVKKKKRDYSEGVLIERINNSDKRIKPKCPYFGICGGCTLQNLTYEDQLIIKQGYVEESIKNISKLKDLKIEKIIPSDLIWRYRHKVELTFLAKDNGDVSLGFYYQGSWWDVVDIKDCFLFDENIKKIIQIVRNWIIKNNLTAFHHKKYTGLLKNLTLRKTHYTNEWMVGITTTDELFDKDIFNDLIEEIKDIINLKSFYCRVVKVKRRKGESFKDYHIYGQSYITERLNKLDFQIKFASFFQNNTLQTEKMINYVINSIKKDKNNKILDLYCGVGTFTLPLAKIFNEQFTGIELVPEAIESATENAKINKINNISFICKDAGLAIEDILHKKQFDIVVVDPPRTGLDAKVVSSMLNSDIKQILYVSCNPATMARDLNVLSIKYKVKKIQPFDLFPQTYHIENIVTLE